MHAPTAHHIYKPLDVRVLNQPSCSSSFAKRYCLFVKPTSRTFFRRSIYSILCLNIYLALSTSLDSVTINASPYHNSFLQANNPVFSTLVLYCSFIVRPSSCSAYSSQALETYCQGTFNSVIPNPWLNAGKVLKKFETAVWHSCVRHADGRHILKIM
jgi:hypothetical protein